MSANLSAKDQKTRSKADTGAAFATGSFGMLDVAERINENNPADPKSADYIAPAEEAEAVLPDIGKLRKQKMGGLARAGGATRSGNEADLLGYVEPVRRKSASRMLLG